MVEDYHVTLPSVLYIPGSVGIYPNSKQSHAPRPLEAASIDLIVVFYVSLLELLGLS